jgi:hypothetical protein
MSVNEPLYNFARAFADRGTKNIIPDSNNEASGLASLINVNGSTVGTLSMSWSTTKAGSKGHYWGNTKSSAAANTWAYSIAQGATIELTSSGGTKFSSCALQVTLGN